MRTGRACVRGRWHSMGRCCLVIPVVWCNVARPHPLNACRLKKRASGHTLGRRTAVGTSGGNVCEIRCFHGCTYLTLCKRACSSHVVCSSGAVERGDQRMGRLLNGYSNCTVLLHMRIAHESGQRWAANRVWHTPQGSRLLRRPPSARVLSAGADVRKPIPQPLTL